MILKFRPLGGFEPTIRTLQDNVRRWSELGFYQNDVYKVIVRLFMEMKAVWGGGCVATSVATEHLAAYNISVRRTQMNIQLLAVLEGFRCTQITLLYSLGFRVHAIVVGEVALLPESGVALSALVWSFVTVYNEVLLKSVAPLPSIVTEWTLERSVGGMCQVDVLA